MKRIITAALIVAMLVLPVGPAHAWNGIGHMIIVKLALDQMGEADQAKIFAMLKNHPHYDSYLAAGKPAEISELQWALMRAAVWPDYVRPRNQDKRDPPVSKNSRAEDHFVDWPFVDPRDAEANAGK